MSNYNCPYCDSKRTQSLPLAHASGQRSYTTVGISRGGAGVGFGNSQSALSNYTSPPDPAENMKFIMWGGMFLSVIIVIPLAILARIIFGVLGYSHVTNDVAVIIYIISFATGYGVLIVASIISHNPRTSYSAQKEEWENSFICLRCGSTFLPQ